MLSIKPSFSISFVYAKLNTAILFKYNKNLYNYIDTGKANN